MGTMPGVSGGGFQFQICSVGGTWKWSVSADNITNSGQYFYIRDIVSPFGKFTDVDLPIPGEVIYAMAESLTQFEQQLAPLLQLVSSNTITVTVTEGDPITEAGLSSFTNAGAFGSFMNVSATPGSSWMTVSPGSVNGVGKNQVASVAARVNPGILLSSNSPYVGFLNLQDNRSTPTVVPVQVNVIVLPRPSISVSQATITFSYSQSSQMPSGPVIVTITNSGPITSELNYLVSKIQNISPWLAFTPQNAGPVSSGGTSDVTLSITSTGIPGIQGTYSETLKISSNNASNSPVLVTVDLVVGP